MEYGKSDIPHLETLIRHCELYLQEPGISHVFRLQRDRLAKILASLKPKAVKKKKRGRK